MVRACRLAGRDRPGPGGSPDERDPYWQIRAGLENLEGAPLIRADAWSWAPVDGSFVPTSPAWNLLLALAWRAAGSWGFFVLTCLALGALLAVVVLLARRLGSRTMPMLLAVVGVCLLVFPMLSARATVPAQALLLGSVLLAFRWSERAATRSVGVNTAATAAGGLVLAAAGVWLHLSWLGLAAAAALAWAVIWLLTPGLGVRRVVALTGGGTAGLLAGVALGPYGIPRALEQSQVVAAASSGLLTEWMSPFTSGLAWRWAPAALVALGAALACSAWVLRRLRSGDRGDPRTRLAAALTAVALPFALAGLQAIRFVGVALLLLAPLLAAGATALAERAQAAAARTPHEGVWRSARAREWTTGTLWRVILGATALILIPGVVFLAAPHGRPPEAAALESLPAGCRLFSSEDIAGAAILLRPDVPIWTDTRAGYWGRERLLAARTALHSPAPQAPTPDGATCVVLPEAGRDASYGRLVSVLQADPGWDQATAVGGFAVWLPADVR